MAHPSHISFITGLASLLLEYTTGTEDHHSSFSETAWDNYQEKYNSENYSEGVDSDSARRLLECDDYR